MSVSSKSLQVVNDNYTFCLLKVATLAWLLLVEDHLKWRVPGIQHPGTQKGDTTRHRSATIQRPCEIDASTRTSAMCRIMAILVIMEVRSGIPVSLFGVILSSLHDSLRSGAKCVCMVVGGCLGTGLQGIDWGEMSQTPLPPHFSPSPIPTLRRFAGVLRRDSEIGAQASCLYPVSYYSLLFLIIILSFIEGRDHRVAAVAGRGPPQTARSRDPAPREVCNPL